MPDPIRLEIADGVAIATLNHPPMNLLDMELLPAIGELADRIADDDTVRVLVLQSANPDFFIAHGDVNTLLTIPENAAPERSESIPWVHATLDKLRTIPKVTIAKVEGFARGGGSETALACDMRFATIGKAVFGQPEIGLGILPGAGGTVRLTQLVGRARASEIIFGGDDFSAEEAERLGWINRALPESEIGPYVEKLARRIARFPASAIAEIKSVMVEVEQNTLDLFRDEQLGFDRCMASEDARRLMQRFVDRGLQTPEGERSVGASLPSLSDN